MVSFFPTHHVNGEVVDKPNFLWIEKDKRKFRIDFKSKNFLVMYLNENKFFCVLN